MGLVDEVDVPRADLLPVAREAPPPQQSVAVPLADAVPGSTPASSATAPAQARTAFHLIIGTLRRRCRQYVVGGNILSHVVVASNVRSDFIDPAPLWRGQAWP